MRLCLISRFSVGFSIIVIACQHEAVRLVAAGLYVCGWCGHIIATRALLPAVPPHHLLPTASHDLTNDLTASPPNSSSPDVTVSGSFAKSSNLLTNNFSSHNGSLLASRTSPAVKDPP